MTDYNIEKMSKEELATDIQSGHVSYACACIRCRPDRLTELLRRLNDYERLKKRVEDATTGWESYAWKNGEYIDSVQKYFDDWKEETAK